MPRINWFSAIYNPFPPTMSRFIYVKTQDMKTLITILFILFIGITAQAQDTSSEVKVKTIEKSIVTSTVKENTVARVYKFKNSRIKKELTFKTKRNKAKLA